MWSGDALWARHFGNQQYWMSVILSGDWPSAEMEKSEKALTADSVVE